MAPIRRRPIAATAAALAVAGLLATGPARAQTLSPEMQRQIRAVGAACRTDIRKYCEGVQPGGGRIAACLDTRRDALSTDCRAAFDAIRRQ